jgi:hypothetical protein
MVTRNFASTVSPIFIVYRARPARTPADAANVVVSKRTVMVRSRILSDAIDALRRPA